MKKLTLIISLLLTSTLFASTEERIIDAIKKESSRELKKICNDNDLTDIFAEKVYATCRDASTDEEVVISKHFGVHRRCKDVEFIFTTEGASNGEVRITRASTVLFNKYEFYVSEKSGNIFRRKTEKVISIDFETGMGIANTFDQYKVKNDLVNCKKENKVKNIFFY